MTQKSRAPASRSMLAPSPVRDTRVAARPLPRGEVNQSRMQRLFVSLLEKDFGEIRELVGDFLRRLAFDCSILLASACGGLSLGSLLPCLFCRLPFRRCRMSCRMMPPAFLTNR